jgi:hypothetical protein
MRAERGLPQIGATAAVAASVQTGPDKEDAPSNATGKEAA